MGAFTIMITNRGKALQAKAQTGVELHYTRFRIGDGQLGGRPISDLNGLINPVLSLPITKLEARPGGRAVVGTVMTNQDVTKGFYLREIGIFAQDPDVGEILYCYGNAGETADYIPAKGGSNIIEEPIDISTIVGNASNVTASIDNSLVYVSKQDFDGHVEKTSVHGATSEATPNRIAIRDTDGQFKVGAPTDPHHVVRLMDLKNGSRFATVIAAADSSDEDKKSADVVCTGTDDQNTINPVLAKKTRVVLLKGTYNISSTPLELVGGTLEGVGVGLTVLKLSGSTAGLVAVNATSTALPSTVSSLSIDIADIDPTLAPIGVKSLQGVSISIISCEFKGIVGKTEAYGAYIEGSVEEKRQYGSCSVVDCIFNGTGLLAEFVKIISNKFVQCLNRFNCCVVTGNDFVGVTYLPEVTIWLGERNTFTSNYATNFSTAVTIAGTNNSVDSNVFDSSNVCVSIESDRNILNGNTFANSPYHVDIDSGSDNSIVTAGLINKIYGGNSTFVNGMCRSEQVELDSTTQVPVMAVNTTRFALCPLLVGAYFTVTGATTTVSVTVTYNDFSGPQTLQLMPAQAFDVGSYSIPVATVVPWGTGMITINAQASIAKKVKINAFVMGG